MDSMKTLNSSLPRSSSTRRSNPPREQLLQSFKSAALSVTNLYKTAAADQTRAHEAGYQAALDDLLAFLDKENLGLDDGEGWKVRKWATERLDGSPVGHIASDSDDDRGESSRRARSNSPVTQRSTGLEAEPIGQPSRSASPERAASAPMPPPPVPLQTSNITQIPDTFTFRSTIPYPQDMDTQTPETTPQPELQYHGPKPALSPTVRVEVLPRGARTPHRATRQNSRQAGGTRALGSGAGSKRRIAFGDYFDIGSLGDGKDGHGGGGKRGRFT